MINFLLVAFGGFIGAGMRYLCSQISIFKSISFPIATLIINFVGSFLIGIISSISPGSKFNLFFRVGVCGGFTTFSTFSLETFDMIESGKIPLAIIYSSSSVLLCLIGVLLGKSISKIFLHA